MTAQYFETDVQSEAVLTRRFFDRYAHTKDGA
jgi:hypothetical protein